MVESTQRPKSPLPSLRGALAAHVAALAVLTIGIAFIFGGLQLDKASGRFPIMLGVTTVALALLEILGASFSRTTEGRDETRAKMDMGQVIAIAWVLLTIFAIYLLGILLGAFISSILFCRFVERRGIWLSIGISASNVFVIWFAFSYLAKFTLYRGAIF